MQNHHLTPRTVSFALKIKGLDVYRVDSRYGSPPSLAWCGNDLRLQSFEYEGESFLEPAKLSAILRELDVKVPAELANEANLIGALIHGHLSEAQAEKLAAASPDTIRLALLAANGVIGGDIHRIAI